MRIWNPNLWPPGGFVFVDADGISHAGGNLEQLASNLANYRIRRELPPGNPIAEIHEQLCAKFPKSCRQGNPPSAGVVKRSKDNILAAGVAQWLRETWRRVAKRQVIWADDAAVKERVRTCLKCPHHKRVTGDCPTCQESVNQVSFQLRAGRDKRSGVLATCKFFETDARVDVLLEQPQVENAPENCWKRTT